MAGGNNLVAVDGNVQANFIIMETNDDDNDARSEGGGSQHFVLAQMQTTSESSQRTQSASLTSTTSTKSTQDSAADEAHSGPLCENYLINYNYTQKDAATKNQLMFCMLLGLKDSDGHVLGNADSDLFKNVKNKNKFQPKIT
jgi:hypothetical protein